MQKGEAASQKFREITEAYENLGNKLKRTVYDREFGYNMTSSIKSNKIIYKGQNYSEYREYNERRFYKEHTPKTSRPKPKRTSFTSDPIFNYYQGEDLNNNKQYRTLREEMEKYEIEFKKKNADNLKKQRKLALNMIYFFFIIIFCGNCLQYIPSYYDSIITNKSVNHNVQNDSKKG